MNRYRLSRTRPVMISEAQCDDANHYYGAWVSADAADEAIREAVEKEREEIIKAIQQQLVNGDGDELAVFWRKGRNACIELIRSRGEQKPAKLEKVGIWESPGGTRVDQGVTLGTVAKTLNSAIDAIESLRNAGSEKNSS